MLIKQCDKLLYRVNTACSTQVCDFISFNTVIWSKNQDILSILMWQVMQLPPFVVGIYNAEKYKKNRYNHRGMAHEKFIFHCLILVYF